MSSEKTQEIEGAKKIETEGIKLEDVKIQQNSEAEIVLKDSSEDKDSTKKNLKAKLENGASNGVSYKPPAKKQKLVLRYDQPEALKEYALLPGLGIYDASSDSDSSSENSDCEDWPPGKYDLMGRVIRG